MPTLRRRVSRGRCERQWHLFQRQELPAQRYRTTLEWRTVFLGLLTANTTAVWQHGHAIIPRTVARPTIRPFERRRPKTEAAEREAAERQTEDMRQMPATTDRPVCARSRRYIPLGMFYMSCTHSIYMQIVAQELMYNLHRTATRSSPPNSSLYLITHPTNTLSAKPITSNASTSSATTAAVLCVALI